MDRLPLSAYPRWCCHAGREGHHREGRQEDRLARRRARESARTHFAGNGAPGGNLSRSAALLSQVNKGEWNSYTIIARGPEITLKINDIVMCQVTDQQAGMAAKDGVIALQMHPGPPMKVQFHNLRIKLLDPNPSN